MKRWEIYLEILCELLLLAGGLFFLGFCLPKLLAFLWPVVLGWVIAVIGHPLRRFLQRKIKVSKRLGSVMIVLLVLLLVSGGLFLVGWGLVSEGKSFVSQAPEIYHSASDNIVEIWNENSDKLPQPIAEQISDLTKKLVGEITGYLASEHTASLLSNFAKSVTNGLIGVIVMFLCAYFFLADWEGLHKRWHELCSDEVHAKVKLLKDNIIGAVGGYFLAQLKLMLLICLLLFVGFLLLKVRFSFVFAILISVLDALPFFGVGTALIPWAVYEILMGNYFLAAALLILYVICLLTRQILQPKVVGDTVGLSPLTTVILMYVGLKLAGIIGFIIAVVLGIVVKRLYKIGIFDGSIARMKRRLKMLRVAD